MSWTRFFKNPKTALAGSSAAILAGVVSAVSGSTDPVSTTLIVTSVISALGGLGVEYFASASEKLFLDKTSREEMLANGDLTRAIGKAIFLLILEESKKEEYGDDRERLETIGNSDEALWEEIVLGIEEKENPRFVLQAEDLEELSPDFLTQYVAAETGKIDEIKTLTSQEWRIIVEKLAEKHELILQFDTAWNVAKALHDKFASKLRMSLKNDFADDGKAYASFQLRIQGEILYYVKENYKTNKDILIKVDKLLERNDQIEALLKTKIFTFDDPFWNDAFNLQKELFDVAVDTLTRVKNLQTDIEEIKQILKELFDKKDSENKKSKIPTKLPVSRFPLRVQFFTGREDVLIAIEESLKTYKTAALCGTHGLGKSSVVTEFAYLNEGKYKNIFFIRAVGAEFDIFIGEIVNDLQIPTDAQTTPAQKLQMFQHWLAENDDWLLILDNVDDVSAIKDCRFTAFGGDVVFTSNDDAVYQIGKRVEVPNMDGKEAASLLFQHWKGEKIENFDAIPAEKHKALLQIAEMFGNSPLAMTFAGVYLAEENESLDEFLETYHDKEQNLLERYEFLSNYQHANVATPFLLAFEAVSKPKDDSECERLVSEIIRDYLKISAFIAPDAIPEEFLSECVKRLHPEHEEIFEDADFFKEVRKRFKKSPIFDRDADTKTFSTHRLVQEVMRFKIKDEENHLLEIISETLADIVPEFDYTNREKVEPYLGHLESFIEYLVNTKGNSADITKLDNQTTNILSYKIGRYNECFGEYEKAKYYYLICRDICEKIYGNNYQEIAITYNNLGNIYYSQGNYLKAEENHLKSLKIYLNIVGKNHLLTATSYNNLGLVYYSQGNYLKAEENLLKALQIHSNIFGKNHSSTASSYNNLGLVYNLQSDYPKAKENHLKSLQICLNIFGDNYPDTASSYNNLGLVYYSLGDYPQAKENHFKALQIYLNIFGENHPSTATSYNNLGIVYYSLGDYQKVEENFLKALEIRLNIFGENHPDIALNYNNLGELYENQDKLTDAEQYYEKAFEIWSRFLPEKHFYIQTVKANLERVRKKMGK
ncbi:MAG TPA: tetratricopeptide repeat protein [Pyrinomonadaceae bacterium]|nr:tetratricopeptide repeat protein [Pyrinomonadaceae bacterium]